MIKVLFFVPSLWVLLLLGCSPRLTGLTPLIPRELFFGNPERTDPQISPDGRWLSYLAPDHNHVMQIWIRPLAGQEERQITAEKNRRVRHYTWTYDGEHLIYAQDSDGDENWHMYAVNIRSGNIRNLTPYKGVRSHLVALDPNFPDQVLVAMNLRNRQFFDVYRITLNTGENVMVNRNPGRQRWWVPDSQFQVRIAYYLAGTIIRDEGTRSWRTLRRWKGSESGRHYSLSKNNKTIYMRAIHGDGDTGALLAVDTETGNETVLVHDPQYDVEDVLVHPITREIQAVCFYKDILDWQILDQSIAEDFALLKKLAGGEFTVLHPPYESPILYSKGLGRRDLQDKTWIVSYESDTGLISHYAYDRSTKTPTLLFTERTKLETLELASVQPISFESRDGLLIRGYLTLPVGVTPKNLATVLLVHGGPWSRDRWGYYDIVQWLTNRGYGVLQVNFRGSTGYGRKFLMASFKEWGGKMHDDLIDGVNWLVKRGIADEKKIAIMGASYGGYATLVGLTLTPEVFVAGISRVGISSLLSVSKTRPPYWSLSRNMYRTRVGDPEKDAELLRSRSPLYYVDKIKTPLLIGHGANDVRVVVAESDQMVEAMRKANKPVEYVVYTDEGHSFTRPENKFHFYARAEEFLAKHLGGRVEPAGQLTRHSGVNR